VNTSIVIFPFDLFGGGGTAAGAQLLGDALREMFRDNDREKKPARARAYQDFVSLKEITFNTLASYDKWQSKARRTIRQALHKGDFLVWVAGNHLSALPIYEELAADQPDTLVIQFDAHLDVYNLSDCTSELSHGNFLRHCQGRLPQIVNLGHRDLFLPAEYVKQYYLKTFSAAELAIDPKPALSYLRRAVRRAERVFIDLDCDVFDPAFFPAVGQALPFGLAPALLLRLLHAAIANGARNSVASGGRKSAGIDDRIIGVALSEFEPARDVNDRSLGTLLWLIEHLLLLRYESQESAIRPTKTS
jgi:arginase family enzyme